jgi:CRP-like cAMP-binding protein
MTSTDAARPAGNRLLNSLTDEERDRLSPHIRPVTLSVGEDVFHADATISRVYFPDSGIISVVTTSQSGERVEVGMVGYEGAAGLAALLSGGVPRNRHALVQVESSGTAIEAGVVREEFRRCGRFHDHLLRYTLAFVTEVSQSVFCQSFHKSDARLARWLVECRLRTGSDEFRVTHEYIGDVLGIRRAGVTNAIGALAEKGIVEHSRGFIRILDKARLEESACECAEVINAELESLFGTDQGG